MLPQDGANNIGQKVALVATVKSSATLRNGRLRVDSHQHGLASAHANGRRGNDSNVGVAVLMLVCC